MKNLFIVGPVASGKTTISKQLALKLGMNNFDTGLLFRFIGWVILNRTQIFPDLLKIKKNQKSEIDRVLEEIYLKRRFLQGEMDNIYLHEHGEMIYKKENDILSLGLFSTQINILVRLVAQSATVRKMIIKFIQNKVGDQKGKWILTGHTLFDLKLSDYIVIYLNVRDEVAAQRLLERSSDSYKGYEDAYIEVVERNKSDCIDQSRKIVDSLYEKIYLDTSYISIEKVIDTIVAKINDMFTSHKLFEEYQQRNAYNISSFCWLSHPLLFVIKDYLQDNIPVYLTDYPQISETDLIYQVLIHVCAYPANILFIGGNGILEEINFGVENRDHNLINKFLKLYKKGDIRLNKELIIQEIYIRIDMLNRIIKDMGMEKVLEEANIYHEDYSGYYLKKSNRKLMVRKIDCRLSTQIFSACHYLHAPRKDEYAAYGVFLENKDFPIAAVSFSLHDRNYKKQLLDYMGLESNNFLEVTRTWCSNGAPQNTQSYLLEYAMKDIRKDWREKKRNKEVTNVLQGFTTTIDPNLNFKASSFLGCNFKHFALRPAKYNYIKIGDINYFKTRREISPKAGYNFTNQISILPLNEMIRVFDEEIIAEKYRCHIYKMDDKNYERINSHD